MGDTNGEEKRNEHVSIDPDPFYLDNKHKKRHQPRKLLPVTATLID